MPTTPFAEEHDTLRDSVRRLVAGPLGSLVKRAEEGEDVTVAAVAAVRDFAGSGDVVADVVIAEELGRLRSGGLTGLALATLAAADAAVDLTAQVVTLAEEGTVRMEPGRAHGELPLVPAGAVAGACVVLDSRIVVQAGDGWEAVPAALPHALRGAAPADVLLTGARILHTDVDENVVHRHELRTAAAAVSAAWQTWHDARAYAEQRTAFGRPIGRFQVNRHALADAATRLTAAEALVHDTAWEFSQGRTADTATARLVAGRTADEVSDIALQLHGGFGYTTAFDVSRAWRDAHALRTGDRSLRRRIAADHAGGGPPSQQQGVAP